MRTPHFVVRNGLLATCALFALVMLASFYVIVSGAVARAASHRSAAMGGTTVSSSAIAGRGALSRRSELLARSGN